MLGTYDTWEEHMVRDLKRAIVCGTAGGRNEGD